jgi:hypothetical protein
MRLRQMSRELAACLARIREQNSEPEVARMRRTAGHRFLQQGFRIPACSGSTLSLRFRRTPCGLSQRNLPRFDFPFPFSFQSFGHPAVIYKLCNQDRGSMFSIGLGHNHKDSPHNRLCNYEQSSGFVVPKIASLGRTSATPLRTSGHLFPAWEGANGNPISSCASAQLAAAADCRVGDRRRIIRNLKFPQVRIGR